jgi:hypothetical protein
MDIFGMDLVVKNVIKPIFIPLANLKLGLAIDFTLKLRTI